METVVILLVGFLASLAEVPRLFKNKSYKELIIFSVFLLTGLGLTLVENFGLLPSPSKGIEILIQSLVKIKFGYQ